jgi:hypothetical protein
VTPPASAAPPYDCRLDAIKSVDVDKYVTADLDGTGVDYARLRAVSDTLGAREQFEVCQWYPGSPATTCWTIRSLANNRYVSSDFTLTGDDNGILRAGSSTVGDQEKFTFPDRSGSGFKAVAMAYNVVTETAFTGGAQNQLRARVTPRSSGARSFMFVPFGLCKGLTCDNQNPYAEGCSRDAVNAGMATATDGTTTTVTLWYSAVCQATWARLSSAPGVDTLPGTAYGFLISAFGVYGRGSMCCSSYATSSPTSTMIPDDVYATYVCIVPLPPDLPALPTGPPACTATH